MNVKEFARAVIDALEAAGIEYSPEDLIVYKIRFYNTSRQTKHVRDIASIFFAQDEALDFDYIDRWVAELGCQDAWVEIIESLPGT